LNGFGNVLHKLSNLSIFKRLLVSFLLLFLLMVCFVVFAVKQITELADMTDNLYNHPFRTTNNLLEAKAAVYNNVLILREIIQEHDNIRLARANSGTSSGREGSNSRIDFLHQEAQALDSRFQNYVDLAKQSFSGDPKLIQQLDEQNRRWNAYREETYRLAREHQIEQAWKRTYDKNKNPVFVLLNQLNNATESSRNDADNYFNASRSAYQQILMETAAAASVIVALFIILALSLARTITRPLLRFRESILGVAEGQFDQQVPFLSLTNELGEISRSLETLRHVALMQDDYAKTKSSVSEIAGALQTSTSFAEFGNALTSRLAPVMELAYGAFYISDSAHASLQRAGGYACADSTCVSRVVWGEGLVGQACLEKKLISLPLAATDGVCTPYGLGQLNIHTILVVPVVHQDEVLAVLELGAMRPFSDERKSFLEMLLPVIAINLEILTGNIETRELLEKSQEQARMLEKQAEELAASQISLAQIEERSRLILGAVNEGIWGLDLEGDTTFVNQTAAEMVGYSVAELSGRQMHPLVHYAKPDGSAYPHEQCPILQTFRDGVSRNVSDEVMWRKDGTSFPIEYATTPLHKNGEIVGAVVVFRDITERKQTEKIMLEARQAAEEATRMKSDFLANMSHEIRTPMNAIIGMTHLALQTELTAKQRNYMGKVDGAAKGLLGIINGILDFSKIEAGKMEFEHIDFDLEDVMEHLADLSVIKAQDKGLELLFDIGADVPTGLIGDPMRLGQVLINLVNNAIKFTETGEIVVGIHRVADEADGVRLRFDVHDTGVGLSEEQRARLFSAFSQADTSTTRKYGGTGLGLTISKRLVEMMGGEIGVESDPGVGSTFFFSAEFGVQRDQKRLDTSAVDKRGLRILVVDDNASAREIFITMLTALKFEATVVSSGVEAIGALEQAQLENQPYGLVLMDWHMPEMDGVEAVRRIRADQRLAETPMCVMVTAYSRDELLQQTQDVQIDGLLVKPVSPSMLFDGVMTAFGKEVVQHPRQQQRQAGYQEAAKAVRGAHVLLVEDNAVNQELALEILNSAGIRVDVASNGAEALEKIGRGDYDGVLMDCQMPVMDGFEATRKIRADARFETLPVIAMTANAMTGDREKCLECGMNDHVAKPIDVAHLFATLARWVKPRSLVPETAGHGEPPASVGVPRLAGVDTDAALARIGGNVALYRTLLTRFREGQGATVELVREALRAGDRETALRLVHTLKGLAGNVGAAFLGKASAELESAIQHEQGKLIESLLGTVREALSFLNEEIDRVMPLGAEEDMKPLETDGGLDLEALTPLLNELSLLLADDDSLAAKRIDPIMALLKGSAAENDFRRLGRLVAQYDTDAALVLLHEITGRLGVQLA